MDEKFNPKNHLIQLKGKDYLQVQWRLVWFREDHPDWCIDTDLINYDPEAKHAIFKAVISDETGARKSAATGSESARDFGDYIEKAETKAIGRALAILGYGTQFVGDELDEGERIVDAPVERKKEKPAEPLICADCGGEIKGGKVAGEYKAPEEIAYLTLQSFGRCLCGKCAAKQ